ncbi:MAG: DUF3108 domain-containing protein [Gemmatimonadaceae bacterium]
MTRVALAAAVTAVIGAATSAPPEPARPAAPAQDVERPFGPGERATYDVKFGAVKVGSGSMEVVGLDTVRGREVLHTQFRVHGGTFFYRVNDLFESWFDPRSMSSLRFVQDQQEGGRDRERRFEIYPDRAVYTIDGSPGDKPSVDRPLDDGSFLFFVRTIPLEVGETYEFNRYFRPERNPVKIRVLRRERVRVPAGSFDCLVVQPIIKTKGIFSENGHAEVWLADDSSRVMVQMKSKLSFGSLNLYLKSYRPPASDRPEGR